MSAPTVFRGENDGVDFSRQQTREQAQPNHETATDKPILNEPNLEARAAASRAAEVAVQVAAGLNALGLHNATRRGVRAELDRAAEVLLNVAVDLVFKHGSNLGFTRKQWENLNRRIAREMAEARTTPEMLASAMNVYYTHPEFSRWAHMHRLEIIRDRLPQLLAIASGTNQKRKPSAYAGVEKA